MNLFARKVKTAHFILIIILAALLLGFSACSDEEDNVYVITDRFFHQQMELIFNNPEEYVGRTIRYEGIIMAWYWPPIEKNLYFVMRPSEDCCAGGAPIGFNVYTDDISGFYEGAWVEVTGVLNTVDIPGAGEVLRLYNATMRAAVPEY